MNNDCMIIIFYILIYAIYAACSNFNDLCFIVVIIFFFSYMYIIDIVKRGSAYKHLLLLLPFQSDMENVATCLL